MKTTLTALLLLSITLVAGQALIRPVAQPAAEAPPSVTVLPPAPETSGLAVAVLPAPIELPPLVVTGQPAKPARSLATLPRHPRAPWEIASWDLGQATLVLDATPRGYVSADPRRPESGSARVDLISLRW